MEEKNALLHERLRNIEKGTNVFRLADGTSVLISNHDAEQLADEIERYYIPRPRFDDGQPVKFGDYFVVDLCKGEEVVADANYVVAALDGSCCYMLSDYDGYMEDDRYRFKRPTPKVLDAEGVEIKVGDTLYYNNTKRIDQRAGIVAFIGSSYSRDEIKFEGETVYHDSKYFTHEKPVFDADGVRICKGDTVWCLTNGNQRGTVETVTPEIEVVWPDGTRTWGVAAKNLTHREPDSRSKVECELTAEVIGRIDELVKQGRWLND